MSNENKKPTMMTRIMNKIRNFFFKKKKISKIIEVNHPPSNRIITMGYCSNIERCPTIRKIHRLCPGDCGKLCCYFCDKCDQCHEKDRQRTHDKFFHPRARNRSLDENYMRRHTMSCKE